MKELRSLRNLAGLTQFQLSARSGVSRMLLGLCENGQAKLGADEEDAVRKVLLHALHKRAAQIEAVLSSAETPQAEV